MNRITIKSESPPEYCEICHRSDRFDALNNYCARCVDVQTERRRETKRKSFLKNPVDLGAVIGATIGIIIGLIAELKIAVVPIHQTIFPVITGLAMFCAMVGAILGAGVKR
jgi:hypothetical protein